MKDGVYKLGVVLTFLSIAGIAESFTGHGSTLASAILLALSFGMVLTGYIK